jgi:hypothetical protein
VYLSLRKSMTIKAYIHTASKRAEIESLLDSGVVLPQFRLRAGSGPESSHSGVEPDGVRAGSSRAD